MVGDTRKRRKLFNSVTKYEWMSEWIVAQHLSSIWVTFFKCCCLLCQNHAKSISHPTVRVCVFGIVRVSRFLSSRLYCSTLLMFTYYLFITGPSSKTSTWQKKLEYKKERTYTLRQKNIVRHGYFRIVNIRKKINSFTRWRRNWASNNLFNIFSFFYFSHNFCFFLVFHLESFLLYPFFNTFFNIILSRNLSFAWIFSIYYLFCIKFQVKSTWVNKEWVNLFISHFTTPNKLWQFPNNFSSRKIKYGSITIN